jgi:hypothetical protein
MKKIITLLGIFLTTCLFSNELSWVDKQITAIKPPREGVSKQQITALKNPFVFIKKEDDKKKRVVNKSKKSAPILKSFRSSSKSHKTYTKRLRLEAIINKSALINGKWYKEGAKLFGYRLKKVNEKSVILVKGKRKIILSTTSKHKNLKIKNN